MIPSYQKFLILIYGDRNSKIVVTPEIGFNIISTLRGHNQSRRPEGRGINRKVEEARASLSCASIASAGIGIDRSALTAVSGRKHILAGEKHGAKT
tara:strand:+ start:101 stop:388 length:288 start_codon:yes stop_codon:yes gene_type:complete